MRKVKQPALKKLFLDKYRDNFGSVSTTCLNIGVNRTTFYNWIKGDAAFKDAIDVLDSSFVEHVEGVLRKRIDDGSNHLLKWYLMNRAPDRWKDESKAVQHSGEIKLEIVRTIKDDAAGGTV